MPKKRPTEDDFLAEDILGEGQDPLESEAMPAARAHRISPRRRYERIQQREALEDVLAGPPEPGESVHILSRAQFDFWTWVPAMLDWIGHSPDLYCSTWTASRANVVELLELWDAGRIGRAHFLTGLYFKRRETAVYARLLEGLRTRGGRYCSSRNHAKVLLLANAARKAWLTIEGSANLTSNPRTENYIITNDRGLWEFHRGWMEELFTA